MDIAISEGYRRKGYSYEAAKTLNKYIFNTENVLAVIRSAYPSLNDRIPLAINYEFRKEDRAPL